MADFGYMVLRGFKSMNLKSELTFEAQKKKMTLELNRKLRLCVPWEVQEDSPIQMIH